MKEKSITTKLTQGAVDRPREDHAAGTQLYDAQVSGLRLVIGKKSATYKLVGRINDGTDRYVTLTIGRTNTLALKDARTMALEFRLALSRGDDPRRPKREVPTVARALRRYLETRPDLSPRTREWYTLMVEGPLTPLARLPMDKLERDQCRDIHERVTRKNGPYMANSAMRILKALHNDVARTIDLPPNPVSRAVRMNKERPRDAAIQPEDMPAMWRALDAIQDPIRRGAFETLLFTGLRSADVKTMRWSNVGDDSVLLVPSPKGGEDRAFRLPLPRHLLHRLEEVRQFTAPLGSDFVFPSPASASGHLSELRRMKDFDYHPHQFRHTLRTHALEAGVDLQTIQLILNHRPQGVTWAYLSRSAVLGPMRDAMGRIAKTLFSYRPG